MLRTRVIPCLLLRSGGGLVKTTQFKDPIYVGDPINAVKIFNDKEVDELAVLDIDATPNGKVPDLARLRPIAEQGFMPISYGGGIRSLEQAAAILKLGVEKVVINTGAVVRPDLISELSTSFGAQSVVAAIDVGLSRWRKQKTVFIRGGREATKLDPVEHARNMVARGAGEILVNAIHRDGTMTGYDLDLIRSIAAAVNVPVIACGGAATIADFAAAAHAGASAAAAGAMFVFQGPLRGVLISYPGQSELEDALGSLLPHQSAATPKVARN
jgi:cyclase